jgi:hypothetical protein
MEEHQADAQQPESWATGTCMYEEQLLVNMEKHEHS